MEEIVLAIKELSTHDCFDWLQIIISAIGCILTVVAIWVGARIPNRIAKNDQKITLYSYRIDCVKNLGRLFGRIDAINTIFINLTNLKIKTAFEQVHETRDKIQEIHKHINIEYQYLFNDEICEKIKFISLASTHIYALLFKLESAMIKLELDVSHNEELWYQYINSDKNIKSILKEIKEACDSILSLEKTLTQETYKVMNLREL